MLMISIHHIFSEKESSKVKYYDIFKANLAEKGNFL